MKIHRYDPIAAAARFRALLEAGDPRALAIARACEAWRREQSRKRHVKPVYLRYGQKPNEQDEW